MKNIYLDYFNSSYDELILFPEVCNDDEGNSFTGFLYHKTKNNTCNNTIILLKNSTELYNRIYEIMFSEFYEHDSYTDLLLHHCLYLNSGWITDFLHEPHFKKCVKILNEEYFASCCTEYTNGEFRYSDNSAGFVVYLC